MTVQIAEFRTLVCMCVVSVCVCLHACDREERQVHKWSQLSYGGLWVVWCVRERRERGAERERDGEREREREEREERERREREERGEIERERRGEREREREVTSQRSVQPVRNCLNCGLFANTQASSLCLLRDSVPLSGLN